MELAAGLHPAVDVLHRDRVGLLGRQAGEQVRQHVAPVEHAVPSLSGSFARLLLLRLVSATELVVEQPDPSPKAASKPSFTRV
ncbi:MAG: hypothetical protein AMXMBFR46_01710 [Acidimicrobiia bacterium]